jgi:hypothetical protein
MAVSMNVRMLCQAMDFRSPLNRSARFLEESYGKRVLRHLKYCPGGALVCWRDTEMYVRTLTSYCLVAFGSGIEVEKQSLVYT